MRKVFNQLIYGRKVFQPLFEKLHFISLYGMNLGSPIDVNTSGELFAISLIKKYFKAEDQIIVFDVGANIGQFSSAVLRQLKNLESQLSIFAFEPQIEAFEQFCQHHQSPSVKGFNLGLSDRQGTATLFSNQISTLSSLYETDNLYQQNFFKKKQEIKLTTLDSFVEEQEIHHIHYLKLDVEGHEMNVLAGAKAAIQQGRISIVQFEFGRANLVSRVFMKDFFEILSEEYNLYRLLKDGLSQKLGYSEKLEIFATTIYIAIQKTIDTQAI